MKTRILGVAMATCAVAALVGVAAVAQTNRAASAITEVKVPEKVDNFRLVDHLSIAHDLYYYKNAPAIVIVSQVNGSPFMRDAVPAIEALKAKYAGKGVKFFMINSTPSNDEAAVKAEAQALGVDIPVLIDDNQLVGENLGVSHVAETYVINPKTWKVEYHGPIDNRFAGRSAKPKAAVKAAYVADAIDAVMAGAPVKAETVKLESPGIAFPQRDRQAEFVKISYADDVAPILAKNCVACHSEGGIAPFAMNSYQMVKGFAPMIREVIRTDRMPPYNADPHIGKFSGDMNLSSHDAQTLVHWIEAGAPRGDSAIDPLKVNAQPAPEWELGTPDLVLEIPAFDVPASGVVDYQNPIVTSPLTEARWIRAVTVKPGDRRAVHHVVGAFSTYAVGGETLKYPDGAGMKIEPGQRLRFQMHYTPYGKATTDVTRVGLYFYPEDKPPVTVRRKLVVANTNIEIPPGEAHHKEVAYVSFPHDATLYAIFVHAHYRGENAQVYLQKPGGKEEMILSVPQYDFNWQRTYELATPIDVPAGSKIVTRYEFDNSPNNPANPDPAKTIVWGEQSWEEMEYTELSITFKGETVANPKPEYMADTEGTRLLGILDADVSGAVEKSDLRGPMAQTLLARWDKLDLNADGKLEQSELPSLMSLLSGGGRGAQQASSEAAPKPD